MMTIPADYLGDAPRKPLGIVLGHGMDADDWKGPFLSRIAAHYARKGGRAGGRACRAVG